MNLSMKYQLEYAANRLRFAGYDDIAGAIVEAIDELETHKEIEGVLGVRQRWITEKNAAGQDTELARHKFIQAFVAGHDWLRWRDTGFVSFPSERDEAEAEANRQFDAAIEQGRRL